MEANVRRLVVPWTLMLVTALFFISGCQSGSRTSHGGAVSTQQIGSQHTLDIVARVSPVSTKASAMGIGGKRIWTYFPTLRITTLGGRALPVAARDLWVWVVYVPFPGTSATAKDLMLKYLGWGGEPQGQSFTVYVGPPKISGRQWRFESNAFSLQPAHSGSRKPETSFYTMLVAPQAKSNRWKLPGTQQITFPISCFQLMNPRGGEIAASLDNGSAAVCIGGFQTDVASGSKLVLLSEPVVLDLNSRLLGGK